MTEIDKIGLGIIVEDEASEKIKSVLKAINSLEKKLEVLDTDKLGGVFSKMTKSISPFINKITKAEKSLTSLATILGKGSLTKVSKEVEKATENVAIGTTNVEDKATAKGTQATALKEEKGQIEETQRKAEELSDTIKASFSNFNIDTPIDRLKFELEEYKASLKSAKTEYDNLFGKDNLTETDAESLRKLQKEMVKYEKAIERTEKAIQGINKETDKTSKKKPFDKVIKSFGRIALYRAIRTVLKEITQAFIESIDGIARYDKEFAKTMGDITSSIAKVKSAIGVAFYQVLIALAPTIENLSNRIVIFANNIAKAMAIMRGDSKYIKINTEYWKEYQSAINGVLLSFDTFTTLGKGNEIDYSKMFEEVELSDNIEKETQSVQSYISTIETLSSIFSELKEILSIIWDGILKPILQSGVTTFILQIVAGIVQLLDNAGLLKTVLLALVGIWTVSKIMGIVGAIGKLSVGFTSLIAKIQTYNLQCGLAKTKTQILQQTWKSLAVAGTAIAVSVLSIVSNWDNMSSSAKGWVIAIAAITAAVAALAFAVYAATQQWAKAISVASGVITTGATVATAVASFEKGGTYQSADLFYANENGKTELIASNNSGGGNVMNLDQWRNVSEVAFYNALSKYGASQNSVVASAKGQANGITNAQYTQIVREINRRNTGMNLI